MVCPLTKLDAADARNIAAPPTSSTFPQRPAGVRLHSHALNSGLATSAAFNGVSKYPGPIALICSPNLAQSAHIPFVRFLTAPFEAVYGAMVGRAASLCR